MNEFDSNIKAAQRKGLAGYLMLGGAAVVALVAYIFWLMLAEGFAIKVLPVEAQASKSISVLSGVGIAVGDSVYSLGGELRVSVDANKFVPQTVSINTNSASTLEVTLIPSPGKLIGITSPAHAETSWSIDNEIVHIGESIERQLKPGSYTVSIDNAYFQPHEQKIEALSDEVIDLNIALLPVSGSLSLSSVPAGADVMVDSKAVGKTPLLIAVEGGRYAVQLVHPDYERIVDGIDITHEDNQAERNYRLEPKKAVLRVSASPDDGVLMIGGQQQKLGENTIYANRTHRVLYQRDGYYSYSESFNLKVGAIENVTIALKPERGKVVLKSKPAADIYINGAHSGKGSISTNLPAIPHRIEFRRAGYRTVIKTLRPSGQRTSTLSVSLLTEFDARRKEGVPLFINSLGIQMARYRPTAFTMGSPVNEKGRRRNEFEIPLTFTKQILVGRHEITEAQYSVFDATKGRSKQPVTDISWDEAARYCNWLSQKEGLPPFYRIKNQRVVGSNKSSKGYRLPMEAEWEWLAKKSQRTVKTIYVWGNQSRIPTGAGNFGDASLRGKQTFVLKKYKDAYTGKAPVGSFRADRAGVYDLAGNVSEWVHDFYSHVSPSTSSPLANYTGPVGGVNHIWKGGNYTTGREAKLRASYKGTANAGSATLGFRIARYY